jgi:hypothetical protein
MQWLIDNSKELGVNAIHDYLTSRIWYPSRGWHTASIQDGDWLHIEVLPGAYSDGRTVDAKLAAAPAVKLDDMGLIVKTESNFYFTTGTLRTRLDNARDIAVHRFMIGLSGGNSADVTGITQAEVDAGYIGMDIDAIAAKLNATAAAITAAAAATQQVINAANGAKLAAEAALAAVKDDDEAVAAIQEALAEVEVRARAAEVAAKAAQRAAEEIEAGGPLGKFSITLTGEATPLSTEEPTVGLA